MSILNWRPVNEVRLREALIPDPAGTGTLDTLSSGRLAVHEGVLYLDPRPEVSDPEGGDHTVTAVPMSGVIAFSYRVEGLHSGEATGPGERERSDVVSDVLGGKVGGVG